MAAKTIKIELKKSFIGMTEKQRDTLRGLGLRKRGRTRTLENTSAVRGMVKKVIQFVEFQEQ